MASLTVQYSISKLAEIYVKHKIYAGRKFEVRGRDILMFARYIEENCDGNVSFDSFSNWIGKRTANINHNGHLTNVHNNIAAFCRWAQHFLGDQIYVPFVRSKNSLKRERRPIIIESGTVAELMRLQEKTWSRNAATYAALTGFLFISGARVGEALTLERKAVNLERGEVYIGEGKRRVDRVIPLSDSAVGALRQYSKDRNRLFGNNGRHFFQFTKPVGVKHNGYIRNLNLAASKMGLRVDAKTPEEKKGNFVARDLRHCFAVRSLIDLLQSNKDIEEELPKLAVLMGHATLESTYWYLEAVPELARLLILKTEKKR